MTTNQTTQQPEPNTTVGNQVQAVVRSYFGHEVTAKKGEPDGHPYPWSFTVREPDGTLHQYGGIPNQCQSARAALRRGWWRAKWLAEGTYHQHYT